MGDELILKSTIYLIKKFDAEARFTILSSNPEQTKRYTDESSLYWSGVNFKTLKETNLLFNILKEIKDTDYIIIGGGGIIQDVNSVFTIPRYLLISFLGNILYTPTIYFSLGVGPINSQKLRYFTNIISNQADFISVRDEYSKKYLEKIGVHTNIEVISDPSLFTSEYFPIDESKQDKKRMKLGVSIRDFKIDYQTKLEIMKSLQWISNKFNINIFLIPMNKKSDSILCHDVSNNIQNCTVCDNYQNPSELIDIYKRMDYIVSMRLHGLIVATSYKIPCIGLVYDKKVDNFMKQIDLHDFTLSLSDLNMECLCNKFTKLVEEKEKVKNKMNENVNELKSKTEGYIKRILQ